MPSGVAGFGGISLVACVSPRPSRILIITTGSKAADLRHGEERLPGRKGRLKRTAFIFTLISFPEFKRVCGKRMSAKRLLPSYLLSGGAPVSCAALAAQGRIPEYIVEMTRDWIYGEIAANGRSRSALLAVMDCIHRFAGSPVGQSKLARETGLSNNTVAAGYIDQLADLLCVASAYSWDISRRRRLSSSNGSRKSSQRAGSSLSANRISKRTAS